MSIPAPPSDTMPARSLDQLPLSVRLGACLPAPIRPHRPPLPVKRLQPPIHTSPARGVSSASRRQLLASCGISSGAARPQGLDSWSERHVHQVEIIGAEQHVHKSLDSWSGSSGANRAAWPMRSRNRPRGTGTIRIPGPWRQLTQQSPIPAIAAGSAPTTPAWYGRWNLGEIGALRDARPEMPDTTICTCPCPCRWGHGRVCAHLWCTESIDSACNEWEDRE